MMRRTTQRSVFLRELDPDRVDDYRQAHDEIWPDLVALYRRCGIVDVSCFVHGAMLAVMLETDPEVYEPARTALEKDPLELRWQQLMSSFGRGPAAPRVFQEIYRQSLRA